MIIVTEAGRARLEEADNLTGFKLLAHGSREDRAAVGVALADAGRIEGDVAWIEVSWLLSQAGARSAEWCESFAGMVAFAKSRGWCDDAGSAIRAHIEWAD